MGKRVHILRHGFTLCGINWASNPPADPNEVWVSFQDPMLEALKLQGVICVQCMAAHT